MTRKSASARFLLCIKNKNYPALLEVRKVYRAIPDSKAAAHRQVRVIDESGEDYLYPEGYFVPLELPSHVAKDLVQT
jgi:hypothetical protein